MHGLAGAIDAALGEDVSVEALGRVAPANAAIGQVERRPLQAQKGVVARGRRGDQHRRRETAFAARQPRREGNAAGVVGGLGRQHLVVARDQPELDAADRLRRRQRIDEGMDAVAARIGGEPEVGDDEPLRCALAVLLRGNVARNRGEHIDAGLELRHRLGDGKVGGDLGVQRSLVDRHLAGPHLIALLLGDVVQAVAVEVPLEVAAEHGVDQIAVADAVDRDLDLVGVDADEGNALLPGLRQHIGLAGKTDEGTAVAHIDVEVRGLEQVLADGRGQAFAERDRRSSRHASALRRKAAGRRPRARACPCRPRRHRARSRCASAGSR